MGNEMVRCGSRLVPIAPGALAPTKSTCRKYNLGGNLFLKLTGGNTDAFEHGCRALLLRGSLKKRVSEKRVSEIRQSMPGTLPLLTKSAAASSSGRTSLTDADRACSQRNRNFQVQWRS